MSTSKLTVCFLVPLANTDQKSIKSAYKEIGSQILKFAEAIKIDSNMLISHSVVSDDPADMKPVVRITADAKIAELQTISKKVASGKSSLDVPKQPDTTMPGFGEEEYEHEKPRVVAAEWRPPTSPAPTPVAVKEAPTPAPAASSEADELLIKSLLWTYDRVTAKSKAVVAFLVKNKDKDVTIEEIAAGCGLEKQGVNSWLSQSAPKAVENISRGVYRLNSAKVKIKS